ncbi:MAG: LysR substrate-binding domain-containing protein [Thiolinea sp.]
MHNQRLPLTALRTFEVAARCLSFKRAARELCVSPTTISNQIRQLERDWELQLFVRKTRRVELTPAGQALAQVVGQSFSAIRSEIERHRITNYKTVQLAIGPIFCSRWLLPRLSRFRRQYPEIELILHHAERIQGMDDMYTPIAVDWGHGDWEGADAIKLMDIVYSPVLSPELLQQRGGIERAEDLQNYPILHQQDRSEWQAWLKLAGINLVACEETIITDSNVVTQAAIDGQGVALGIFPFIQSEVDSGRLVRPLTTELSPTRSYYLLASPAARQQAEVDAVCRWLEAEATG